MNNQEIIWYNGEWSTTDKPAIGITDHALWMASTVFDGARAVKGHLRTWKPTVSALFAPRFLWEWNLKLPQTKLFV